MAQAAAVIAVVLEIGTEHVGGEQRYAVLGLDSRKPDKWQTARVQGAIFRRDSNANHLLRFQAKEHNQLSHAFQFYRARRSRALLHSCAGNFVTLALQAARSAVTVAAIIAAARVVLTGDLVDSVADPFRLLG